MAPANVPSMRAAAAEPEPRRLARLAAGVGRHWARAARAAALAGGLSFGGWTAATELPAAPFLAVDDVVVAGNELLAAGEVLALMPGVRGAGILSVDLEDHRRRLAASPWIAGAALRRRLPSTVEVFVTERRPVAVARFGGRLFLLDASGAVLDGYGPRFARFDFPIVDGLTGEGDGAAVVDPRRLALAARLLGELAGRPDVLDAVSQIDVADPRDAVVLLDGDVVLLRLGAERFLPKLRRYAELAPLLREEARDIDEVDLRFDPRVYVRYRDRGGAAGRGRPRGAARSAAGKTGGALASRRREPAAGPRVARHAAEPAPRAPGT